jgi:hypothetical protein
LLTKLSTDCVRNFDGLALLANCASENNSVESRACGSAATLAHSIVHRRCAKSGSLPASRVMGGCFAVLQRTKAPNPSDCRIFAQRHFTVRNQPLRVLSGVLLTILSTKDVRNNAVVHRPGPATILSSPELPLTIKGLPGRPRFCSQSYPQNVFATGRARHPIRARFGTHRRIRQIIYPCLVFAHERISLMNQGACRLSTTLRTILSTKGVQNSTCRVAGNTLHCRIHLLVVPHLSRSSFCSPFFKLQAGQFGCC